MIIKNMSTSVDLYTSDDIYCTDIKQLLITKLTERYKGKCYKSVLIMSINKIVKHSAIYMADDRLDGSASINVNFDVNGFILLQNEVLHGCKVVDITVSGILVEHKYAGGLVHADMKKQITKIIKKDQIIPVTIYAARYNPNQTQITIRGAPFEPINTKYVYYHIDDILSPEETEKVAALLELFEQEMKLHKEIQNNKNYEFFKDIIYPYVKNQKYLDTNIGKDFKLIKADLVSFLEIRSGYLVSPTEAYKLDTLPIYHSDKKHISDVYVIRSSLYPALADIIDKRIMYLQNLRGFAECYDTPDKIKDMMAYWQVCNKLKA
jgi:DNA-directed RNA polymerase subunit E'/Rpb7